MTQTQHQISPLSTQTHPDRLRTLISATWDINEDLFWGGASLVAQLIKNPPAMQTLVGFLGREDPLEKEYATHSSILVAQLVKNSLPMIHAFRYHLGQKR